MDSETRQKILELGFDAREIRAWIEHWQDDVAANLKPTETSLAMAREKADKLAKTLIEMGDVFGVYSK